MCDLSFSIALCIDPFSMIYIYCITLILVLLPFSNIFSFAFELIYTSISSTLLKIRVFLLKKVMMKSKESQIDPIKGQVLFLYLLLVLLLLRITIFFPSVS